MLAFSSTKTKRENFIVNKNENQINSPNSITDSEASEDINISSNDLGSLIHLNSSKGLLLDKSKNKSKILTNHLASIINYRVRGHRWNMNAIKFSHLKSEEFVIWDERGQVYFCNLIKNTYEMVKLASSSISCIEFLPSKVGKILIAYHNGSVIIVDVATKKTLLNVLTGTDDIDNNASTTSPIVLLHSHPTKSLLVMVSESGIITLWNTKLMEKINSLTCDEPIIDVNFEHKGNILVVLLENSGAYFYRTSDNHLICHFPLPTSERCPTWRGYCAIISPVIEENPINVCNSFILLLLLYLLCNYLFIYLIFIGKTNFIWR
jgi:WD40 repeat protein